MTVIVSDTSPLNYLIQIGEIEILGRLFGKVLIPPMVLQELRHRNAPASVTAWTQKLPAWLEVKSPETDDRLKIGPGEDEAIALAMEIGNAILLMDDRKGAAAANRRHLTVVGTLAVLDSAEQKGLLDFEDAVARLKTTSFYFDDAILNPILAAVRARKS